MALIAMDGFEQYGDRYDFLRGPWQQRSSQWAEVKTGRHHGQAMSLHQVLSDMILVPPVFTSELWLGFAWKLDGPSITAYDIVAFMSNTQWENVQLQLTVAGELELRQGGTLKQTTSGLGIVVGTWYYIEIHVVISDTVGEYEVRVDETVQLGPAALQDTKGSFGPDVDSILFRYNSTSDPMYDDLYLCDNTGLVNNDFLGDVQVETMFPTGDGNRNDMTPLSGLTNYEMVDNGSTPDDDTTYVSGAVVGDDELYTSDVLTGGGFGVDTVHAVGVVNHVRKADSGNRTGRALVRSNVTELEGTTKGTLVSWQYSGHIYETDPDGGGAWDEASANAVEFGFTIES